MNGGVSIVLACVAGWVLVSGRLGRLSVTATGNPYPRSLAAAPLRKGQRALIRDLGYDLA